MEDYKKKGDDSADKRDKLFIAQRILGYIEKD